MAGQVARVWANEVTVHVTIGGQLARTVPSSLDAEDLAELRMRGAAPAGQPPAMPPPGGPACRRRDRGQPDRRRRRERRHGRTQGQDRARNWPAARSRCALTGTSCASSATASSPRPYHHPSRSATGRGCARADRRRRRGPAQASLGSVVYLARRVIQGIGTLCEVYTIRRCGTIKRWPVRERIQLPHLILRTGHHVHHTTGFDREEIIDLCIRINSVQPGGIPELAAMPRSFQIGSGHSDLHAA